VRDNRDLLIDIHRFLAWKLRTAAEAGGDGSIEQGILRQTLLVYLDSEGESTAIVGDLFDGIVERVGALVSRVLETYEFEVQPLREYFAARYLYDTAPYSPAGDERAGTKLDRFDALVRNAYWLNVARFYGGCFSKGEISALADELAELANSNPYRLTSHPRTVALTLLSDWVFTQYQPAVRKVVALICEYPQFRQLLARAGQTGGSNWSALPDRSGRADFLDMLWERAAKAAHLDERQALASAIVENSPIKERAARWESVEKLLSHGKWVSLGGMLQIFEDVGSVQLKSLSGELSVNLISALVEAGRFDFLEEPKHFEGAQRALLNEIRLASGRSDREPVPGRLGWLATICGYHQYAVAVAGGHAGPLRFLLEHARGSKPSNRPRGARRERSTVLPERERNAVDAYGRFLDTPMAITSTTIDPWVDLVEALRAAWGDCPAIDRIAFVGAGVRSKKTLGSESPLERATDLVNAARYVRLKSGAPRWWEERFKDETNLLERKRLLLLLWLWGTGKTILTLSGTVGETLNLLDLSTWINLWRDYSCLRLNLTESLSSMSQPELERIKKLGPRACVFFGLRLHPQLRFHLGTAVSDSKAELHLPEANFALEAVIHACRAQKEWKLGLPHIRSLYSQYKTGFSFINRGESTMPQDIAEQISVEPEDFPLSLVAEADSQLLSASGMTASKLLDIANREGWFQEKDRPSHLH
jgi:hypothetical protein